MRMVAERAEGPLATPCTMTEETRELARGSPGDPARSGGRLKFFKDGKFILELVRSGGGAEGGCGGGGWVSVPRKTFWPPAAAPAQPPPHAGHARTDRAASLSVSDDNSSVQSSPWQRDHCWKQSSPRRNISKQLALYYCRPGNLPTAAIAAAARAKRRRPFDTAHAHALSNGAKLSNGVGEKARNGRAEPQRADCGDAGADTASASDDVERWMDRERYYHMKLKKPYQYHKLRVYKKCRPCARRPSLLSCVEKMRDRAAALPAPVPVHAKLASCRQEHALVSPRKRILRELERVSLEDQGGKRKAKTAPALSTAAYPPSPGPSRAPDAPPAPAPARANGSRRDAPKHVGSYSIHSLLSMPDDGPAEARRHAPARSSESPAGARSPDPSAGYRPAPAPAPAPQHYARDAWRPDEWLDGLYAPGYPPAFRLPHAYRAPPSPVPWVHYIPPGPWAPLPHPLLTHHIPKEEPSSDLPLNLSKH